MSTSVGFRKETAQFKGTQLQNDTHGLMRPSRNYPWSVRHNFLSKGLEKLEATKKLLGTVTGYPA